MSEGLLPIPYIGCDTHNVMNLADIMVTSRSLQVAVAWTRRSMASYRLTPYSNKRVNLYHKRCPDPVWRRRTDNTVAALASSCGALCGAQWPPVRMERPPRPRMELEFWPMSTKPHYPLRGLCLTMHWRVTDENIAVVGIVKCPRRRPRTHSALLVAVEWPMWQAWGWGSEHTHPGPHPTSLTAVE